MSNNLYLLSKDRAVEMNESLYESEDRLQELIAINPQLLLRDTGQDGARLMLIAREYTVEEGEGSNNSYSLDHLFVDQNGTPVLVEVKRSTDTRIRREVIAQMMDYASRASTWDTNELRALFRENNPAGEVLEAYDTDAFWERVATCLKAERIKLVFAADKIPNTLKTLIEFMDRSMKDIEVYGVEIQQYKTEDATLLSSNVVGETPIKPKASVSRTSVEWTAASFSSFLMSRDEGNLIPVVQNLQTYAEELGVSLSFGRGGQNPTLAFKLDGRQLLSIMGWSKKSKGDICTAELCIRDLLSFPPGSSWGEETLRSLFSNMPGKAKAEADGLMWNTRDFLYIDLHTMLDDSNLSYFKVALKAFRDAIIQSAQGIDAPPPEFSTFDISHNSRAREERRSMAALAFFFVLHITISEFCTSMASFLQEPLHFTQSNRK